MDWKICIFVLFFASLFIEDTLGFRRYYKLSQMKRHLNVEDANEFQEKYDQAVDDMWEKHTRADTESPVFFSTSFNSSITGKMMESLADQRPIYAFQGFRYGDAVGAENRFKPPIPVHRFWDENEDNFNATHIGFKCPQDAMVGNFPAGEEDCLFLNVYTPVLPTENMTNFLPVMFFIHGGAFTVGDASMYLPTKLLDHDVILVTIHYRLGAFGFFTLNNDDAPGNAALYDMVEALRWTQNHIQDFGGDKDKITIVGESAGSVSVNYLMLIEAARGMFSGVIAESGSALDHWAIDEHPEYAARFLANQTNCLIDDKVDFTCMSTVDAYELVTAEGLLVETDRQNGYMGFRGAAPTIQNFTSANENFTYLVTKHPKEHLLHNDFADVPFMTGANKQEGSFVFGLMYYEYFLPNGLSENVTYMRESMIPDILKALGMIDDTNSLAVELHMQHCPEIDLGNFTAMTPCIIDILGVLFLKAGSWQVANYHSYHVKNNETFYYSFEFPSDDSMFAFIVGQDAPFDAGITHSDELMYLFSMPAVMDTEEQIMTMKRMTKLWTNFATYSNPTPLDQEEVLASELQVPIWKSYNFEDHHYMLIDDTFVVGKEFSDRWSITVDELRVVTSSPDASGCTGDCATYKDQRDAFEITMIVFIVATFVAAVIAVYFFFKARR